MLPASSKSLAVVKLLIQGPLSKYFRAPSSSSSSSSSPPTLPISVDRYSTPDSRCCCVAVFLGISMIFRDERQAGDRPVRNRSERWSCRNNFFLLQLWQQLLGNFPELVLVRFRLLDSPRFLSPLDGHCHVLGLSGAPYGETSSPFWQLESKFFPIRQSS